MESRAETIPDERLVGLVLSGNREAYRPLVERYEPAVFGLCRKLLGYQAVEAEDLSQETFIRAFERLGELKDRRRFSSWLYQIARSLCRDRLRRLATESQALRHRAEALRRRKMRNDGPELRSVLEELPA